MSGERLRRAPLVALYGALAALVAGAALVAPRAGVPLSLLTRDVFSVGEIPVYSGFFSNLGVFMWCAAGAVCLFAWLVSVRAREDAFLLATAGLSGILLADDFWMVHEWIAPRFLGLREEIVLATYGTLAALYAIRYRARIRGAAPRLFVAVMLLFALVIGLDVIEPEEAEEWRYWLEDGIKLFAIGTWLAFAASAAAAALASEPGVGRAAGIR